MTCHPKGGQPATQKGGSQPPKRGAASHTKGGQPATQKGGSQPHKRGAASHPKGGQPATQKGGSQPPKRGAASHTKGGQPLNDIFLEFQAQPQLKFLNPPNSSKSHKSIQQVFCINLPAYELHNYPPILL